MQTNTVIIGKPRTGKAILLNHLIQERLQVRGMTIEDRAKLPASKNPFHNEQVKIVQKPKDSENN